MLREIKLLPRLELDDAVITRISENMWKIDTVIHNLGYLPTSATKEAVMLKTALPLKAELSGADIITGKVREEIGHLEGVSGISVGNTVVGPAVMKHAPNAKHLSWVVNAEEGTEIEITVSAPRAGMTSQKFILLNGK